MSDVEPQFGAGDIAGSKFTTPSQMSEHEVRLGNEAIRRKEYSRWFSAAALVTLTLAAVGCLLFSMWVGYHFLNGLDEAKADAKAREDRVALKAASEATPQPIAKKSGKVVTAAKKEESKTPTAESNKETFYLHILAPLIPATFSSAIAIILFITIARLVTNFERMGREHEQSDKDQNEDYGTIAAFFQELGKFVKSFKS
ncbi:hypothetical protein U8291_12900 [Pseudomonas sp. A2]|uniref:hypothetical protein n=1 Tax=Pseudomonas sp. A2 TaxID=107445 RepID=UPI002B53F03A|nr:hypothetical protein [Pseudomonas sp. A2]MEB3437922.1 hypothetical protein [Pseudomonas sp. A2]